MGVANIWKLLPSHWRAALDEAWEAYKAGSVPIGAVIVDAEGRILTRGRSRRFETTGEPGTVFGSPLAHAELNALLALDYAKVEPPECILYTTVEPCPLCMGAAYMAGIRRILYASHDPWAGSANMLGATPYLSMKPVKCPDPDDPELEEAMIALNVEFFCQGTMRRNDELIDTMRAYRRALPRTDRNCSPAGRSGRRRGQGCRWRKR